MTGNLRDTAVVGATVLTAGAIATFAIAALHLVCAIVGPPAYRYFGAGEAMASKAAAGSPIPALITLPLTGMFAASAFYALSLGGRLQPLPASRWIVLGVGIVFALRGLQVFPESLRNLRAPGSVPVRFLVFSVVALLVGALYLVGVVCRWRFAPGSST